MSKDNGYLKLLTSVLVVEDEALYRDFLVKLIKQMGFAVVAVGDGAEAIQLLDKNAENFDLILSDIYLPNLDGLQLVQFCRALPKLRHIPIIFITNDRDPDLRRRGRKLGVSDVLIKNNTTVESLDRSICRVLKSA